MDSANIKNKIMNRENIQEDFRKQTGKPTITLNKCEVGTNPEYVIWLEKRILALSIPRVSGSCPIAAIMHYDKLIKTKLERTFEPLRDHGTHADFCNKINDLREEAKSNYR